MRRGTYWMVPFCVLFLLLPSLPIDAAPSNLSTFSGGRDSVPVALEPRPSFNRSLTLTLPWDAEVSSASLNLRGEGLPETRMGYYTAATLAAGDVRNLTLQADALGLDRANWSWGQEGAGLGAGCDLSGGALAGGFVLGNSNPSLSASGGGVWKHRVPLGLTETGGMARTNETVDFHISLPQSAMRNPWNEVRVCDGSLAEIPCHVWNASFSGGWCTGADVVFVAPSLAANGQATYYLYYGNPAAGAPSYGRGAYFADSFSAPPLSPYWAVTNLDGLSYSVGGELRIDGTATSPYSFWQGVIFDRAAELPAGFSAQATMRLWSATGTGYYSRLSIVQDAQNLINLGLQYDSGSPQYSPAKYVLATITGGAPMVVATVDAVAGASHQFNIVCSSGTYTAYVDGVLLGSASISLSSPRIQLAAAARSSGDSVNVSFDEVIAYTGYSSIQALDPALVASPAGEEDVGYETSASLTSPLIENTARLPWGTASMKADLPAATSCNISVLGPDNETILDGLKNADPLLLSPDEHPVLRLRATIASADPGATPRLLAWGTGDRWEAGPADLASSSNITSSQGGWRLSRAPELWSKMSGPALNPGITSTFDDIGVARPCVLYTGGQYRMYYAGYDGTRWRIGLATSPDGLNWTRHPDNPLLLPGSVGSWDSSQVDWPFVIYNGSGYQMWYAGSDDGGATFRIGYACSKDGVRWTKTAGPVMSRGASGTWNANSVLAPRIIYDGSSYTMWYAGKNATVTCIGMATSIDGVSWTGPASSPVLAPQPGWGSSSVIPGSIEQRPGQGFSMWFSGSNATFAGVGYATSADGETWSALPGPVLVNGTAGAFDRAGATNPSVIFSPGGMMWYSANNGTRWRICAARAGFCPEGELLSAPVDLGTAPAASAISFATSAPGNSSLTVQARTSSDAAGWGPWISGAQLPSLFHAKRFIQWTARLRAGNDSTPVISGAAGDFEYYRMQGEVRLAQILIPPGQSLGWVSASAATGGAGSVLVQASSDGCATWLPLAAATPLNLSGGRLAFRVLLTGNYTESPTLSSLSVSFAMLDFPADVQLDAGGDGTAEWSLPGVFNGTAMVPELASALNSYLEAHRGDAGDTRNIPLVLSSSARGMVTASGLRIEYGAKVMPNHPPEIRGVPPDRAQVGQYYVYRLDARDQDRRDVLAYSLTTAPAGMTVSSVGEVSWMPESAQVGYQPVVVAVGDGHIEVVMNFTVTVSVSPINMPPKITSLPPAEARVGYEYVYTVTAIDPNSEPIRFSLAPSGPEGATINETSGRLSWVPGAAQAGNRTLEVLVSDQLDTVHHRFGVLVRPEGANSLPVVTSAPPPAARVNVPYVYQVAATDADGDALVFSLVSAPPDATVSSNGTFEWTPRSLLGGNVSVVLRISDTKGYALYSFSFGVLTENRSPSFTSTPFGLRIVQGASWSYSPMVSNPESDQTLRFRLDKGPIGMTIDPATGRLTWKPSPSQAGKFTVNISVSDGLATTVQTFSLTVVAPDAQKGFLESWWPALAVAAAAVAAGGASAVFLRRRKAEPGPRKEKEDDLKTGATGSPEETYEKDLEHGGEAAAGLAKLPPPESAHGATEAEPMKPTRTAEAAREAGPARTPAPSAPAPAERTPAAGTAAARPAAPTKASLSPPPARPTEEAPAAVGTPRPLPAPPAPPAPADRTEPPASLPPPPPSPFPVSPLPPGPALPPPPPPVPTARTAVAAPDVQKAAEPQLYKPIPGPYSDALGPASPGTAPTKEPPAPLPGRTGSLMDLLAGLESTDRTEPTPPAGATETGKAPPPSGAQSASVKEDMDFLRSYLADSGAREPPKPQVATPEWEQIKSYAQGLGKDEGTTRGAAPAAPPPPAAAPPPPPPPPPQPSKPAKTEQDKQDPELSLSLDDILKDLDGEQ